MSRSAERGRRAVGVLAVAAFLLGFVATPDAASQTDPGRPDVDQFGGFIVSARSNAIQVTYDSPGLLPTGGAPILQVSVPEALANLNSGPVGFARSSFVFPGALIADFGAALEQTGTEGVPVYPIRNEAFFPSGPTESKSGDAGTETTASTEFADSRAAGSYAGTVVPGVLGVGGVTAASRTTIEGGELVARTRTEISDLQLLGGIIGVDAIVTDLVAASNGSDAATAGFTTVDGITVLGLRVELAEDGLRFADPIPPPATDPDAGNAVTDLFGELTGGATDEVLDGLREQVQPLLDQLNAVLTEAGDATLTGLAPVLDLFGIEFNLLEAVETKDGGTAERIANGLGIKITYDGGNTPLVTDLLNAVPEGILPNDNLGPIPLSPASIFAILKELSIINVALGPGSVSVAATPAFEADIPGFVPAGPIDVPSSSSVSPPTPGSFSSAAPTLAAPPAADAATVPTVPASSDEGFPFGDALPLILVLMMLFSAPLWAAGSSRLADNALAATAGTCPDGLDGEPLPEDGP